MCACTLAAVYFQPVMGASLASPSSSDGLDGDAGAAAWCGEWFGGYSIGNGWKGRPAVREEEYLPVCST